MLPFPRGFVYDAREPAVVIDGAVAGNLKILRLMPILGIFIIKAVGHAHSLDRKLLYTVYLFGFGQVGRLEHGGRYIDYVEELAADPFKIEY